VAEQTIANTGTIAGDGESRGNGWKSLHTGRLARPFGHNNLVLLPFAAFIALALIGSLFSVDPVAQNLSARLMPPALIDGSWNHPFGTDSLGRDILSRILVAARLSLVIGLVAASISALIGVTLGVLSGAIGGALDTVVTAIVELALSIPTIVIGIVLVSTLGQSMTNLLIILVISGWISYARVVRLQARNLVHSDFVMASVALGAGRSRIAFRHLLPNVLPQVVVLFCQQVAAVMLWEASLTYLGIGLPIERISLGGMIKEGQQQVFDGWWIGVFPGLAIALAVIGFNLLADWLQEAMDPARRGARHWLWSGRKTQRKGNTVAK
jgi:peptide/nickel transport system permease protein